MRSWHVNDVMTRDVVTVRAETPYRTIVDILAERRVSAIPVTDADRRVLGVVSEADLLHKIEFVGDDHERRMLVSRRRRQARTKAHGTIARELMSTPAVTVEPGTTLTAAAKLMDDQQVKRLPVVDERGRLVGIVSRGDLLRMYLRDDADTEDDVVGQVLHDSLWIEPDTVAVRVHDGVVTLTGRTDRYTTARLVVRLTQTVPGVVEVIDQLGFEYDDRRLAATGASTPSRWPARSAARSWPGTPAPESRDRPEVRRWRPRSR